MVTDVIVIGGGLAGLTAAARVAAQGPSVRVLESAPSAGGRSRTPGTGAPGFARNLGPHALRMDGPGTGVLRELGVDLPGGSPRPAATRWLVDDRLHHTLHPRVGGLRVVRGVARLERDARAGDRDGSVAAWLAARIPDGAARAALAAVLRLATYSDGHDQVDAEVAADALRDGAVRYLDGGWERLVAALRTAATGAGAEVATGAGAAAITADGGRWIVHRTDGGRESATAVIVAAGGPADAAALLPGPAADSLRRHAERISPVRMACLDVALRRRPRRLPSLVLGTDEPIYLSVHSDVADLAPDGGAVVHLAWFLAPGTTAEPWVRDRLERMLDRAAPGWRELVVHRRYLPDLVVTHDAGLVRTGGLQGRHPGHLPELPGVTLAGDWVGPTGTLAQASLVSADVAARAAVRQARDLPTGADRP